MRIKRGHTKERKKVFIIILFVALSASLMLNAVCLYRIKEQKKEIQELQKEIEESQKKEIEYNIPAKEEEKIQEEEQEREEPAAANDVVEKKGIKIAIDPGHQGSQIDMSEPEPIGPGATEMKAKATGGTTGRFTGIPESELNLNIAKQLRVELEDRGYEVLLTREDQDTAISNRERAIMASDSGADIYIRIHANGSEDISVSGAMSMVPSETNPYVGDLAEDSYKLGQCILNAYCNATGFQNNGVQLYDNMSGINWSKIPVTILEMGYMTNQNDDENMEKPEFQKKMVQGIAEGIDKYFEETNLEERQVSEINSILQETIKNGTDRGENWGIAIKVCNEETVIACDNQKMQAASLIKLYIMGAVYESYDNLCQVNGKETIDQLLFDMITVSNNEAANKLVSLLGQGDEEAGRQAVNVFCTTNGYTNSNMGRMLLENNANGENYTSPENCMEILWDIYSGKFTYSQDMLELLKAQKKTEKIPAGVPEEIETANKTGELSTVENDAAIIWAHEQPYIICVMSENLKDTSIAREEIVSFSKKIYEKFQEGS